MSWNIENIEAQKPNALCPEETLSHLAEYLSPSAGLHRDPRGLGSRGTS